MRTINPASKIINCTKCGKPMSNPIYKNYSPKEAKAKIFELLTKTTTPIEKIVPELNKDDREILYTGICITCWDAIPID